MRRVVVCLLLWAVLTACRPSPEPPVAAGESVLFLIRHAEKVDESQDPPLSEQGRRRAEAVAHMLSASGIGTIYSSDFLRTRDTAAPLARELGIEVKLYDRERLPELARALLGSRGRFLIVGHSDTTPQLVHLLGGEPGSDIARDEYDRLYVLLRRPGTEATTILLRLSPL